MHIDVDLSRPQRRKQLIPRRDSWHLTIALGLPTQQGRDVGGNKGAGCGVGAAGDVERRAQLGQEVGGSQGIGGLLVGLEGDQGRRVVCLGGALFASRNHRVVESWQEQQGRRQERQMSVEHRDAWGACIGCCDNALAADTR